jgi:hypothetical protein
MQFIFPAANKCCTVTVQLLCCVRKAVSSAAVLIVLTQFLLFPNQFQGNTSAIIFVQARVFKSLGHFLLGFFLMICALE